MKYKRSSKNTFSDIHILYIAVGVLTILTVLSGLFLSSNLVSADNDSVVDSINLTIPVSCTLSGTGMNTHNANVNNGTYTPNIGTTTLKAFCNDSEGFAIYASGYTGNEIGGTNSNKLVGTAASNNAVIDTGINTSGDTSNWAMKLSVVSSPTPTYPITIDSAPNVSGGANASFSDYHTVPNGYTKVAHRDSGTDIGQSAEGATLNTTYAAYISKTQPADTYSGQVIYTLVHPTSEVPQTSHTAESGKICYYPNGSNVVGAMACQNLASPISLRASNFSRNGYGFAGWSTTYDYSDSTGFYGPQEVIAPNISDYSGTNNGLSLYARWIKSAGTLQNWTGCPSLQSGTVTALTDQRDNETYAVAKLIDGNCWMIENLRLENTNSDNSAGSLAQGYATNATYGNFSGLANAESTGFTGTYTANSLYYSNTQEGTATINIGASNFPSYRMPRYSNINTKNRADNPTSNTMAMYSYGNYYTWPAAIADTSFYDSSDNNNSIVNTSICPSGWRLPKGGSKDRIISNNDNEFWNLTIALNNNVLPLNYSSEQYPGYLDNSSEGSEVSAKLRAYPNNFLLTGSFHNSAVDSRGGIGYYWSSTASVDRTTYRFSIGTEYVYPGSMMGARFYGKAIRCIVASGS